MIRVAVPPQLLTMWLATPSMPSTRVTRDALILLACGFRWIVNTDSV
jgi:hypothetical protein